MKPKNKQMKVLVSSTPKSLNECIFYSKKYQEDEQGWYPDRHYCVLYGDVSDKLPCIRNGEFHFTACPYCINLGKLMYNMLNKKS